MPWMTRTTSTKKADGNVSAIVWTRIGVRVSVVGMPDVGLVDHLLRDFVDADHTHVRKRPHLRHLVGGPHESNDTVGNPGGGDPVIAAAKPVCSIRTRCLIRTCVASHP